MDIISDDEYRIKYKNKKYNISDKKKFHNILKSINNYKDEIVKCINDNNIQIDKISNINYLLNEVVSLTLNIDFSKYNIENIKYLFTEIINILMLCNINNIDYDYEYILITYQYFLVKNINFLTTNNNFKKLKRIKNFEIFNESELTKEVNYFLFIFPKYEKSSYKIYIKKYLDYIILKYKNTDLNRILNLISLLTNNNVNFKYFKTFFKIYINKIKSINKPYGSFLSAAFNNKCNQIMIDYIYEKYNNYLSIVASKNEINQLIYQNFVSIKSCIINTIKNNDIINMEKLHNLIIPYINNLKKEELYLSMIYNWENMNNSNTNMLLKIDSLLKSNRCITYKNIFGTNYFKYNYMKVINTLIKNDKISANEKNQILVYNFSLENLVKYPHLYKDLNIKSIIRNDLLHCNYSNNKLRIIIKKLNKIFENNSYLKTQIKNILNKKTFIEEYMENNVYGFSSSISRTYVHHNFFNMINIFYKNFNMVNILIRNIKHCISEDSVYMYELVFCNPNSKIRTQIINNIFNFYKTQSMDIRKEKLFEMIEYLNPNDDNYNTYIYNKEGIPLYKIDNKILNIFDFKDLNYENELVKEIINKYPYITTIDEYYTNFVKNNLKIKECIICFEEDLCYTFKCHNTHSICENCFPKIIKKECPLCRINNGFEI